MSNKDREDPKPDHGKGPPDGKGFPSSGSLHQCLDEIDINNDVVDSQSLTLANDLCAVTDVQEAFPGSAVDGACICPI